MKKRKRRNENPIGDPYKALLATIFYRALLDYIGIFYKSNSVLKCSLFDIIAAELWLRKSPWARTILDSQNIFVSNDEFVDHIHKQGIWLRGEWVKRSEKLDKLCEYVDLHKYLYLNEISEYSNMSIEKLKQLIHEDEVPFTCKHTDYLIQPIEMIKYKIRKEWNT